VNHTLRIFTKNGHGTTSTSLSGEFPAKLDIYANVAKDFALQWARDKAGAGENGNLHITQVSGSSPLGSTSVTLPAGATGTNISYSIPNLTPGTYELLVAGDKGNSNRVTINYGGATSTGSTVGVTAPPPGPAPAPSGFTITFTKFRPMQGTPGQDGYKRPRLSYTITSSSDMLFPTIDFQVDSSPYTDPGSITAAGPASYPAQTLFQKQVHYSVKLYAGKPKSLSVDLNATSDLNWFLAYGKTETGTFRWSVSGQGGNSEQHPVQKAWP
jgi:hypothetical protein